MKTIKLTDQEIQEISCMLENIHLLPLFKHKRLLAKHLVRALQKEQPQEMVKVVIKDFTKDKDEPAYDVECYINGEFDKTYDGVFSITPFGANGAYKRALKHAIKKLQEIDQKIR